MRLVIDMQGAQTISSGHRGVGRYTVNIVEAILKSNTIHEIILAFNGRYPKRIGELKALYSQYLPPNKIVIWQNFFDADEISVNNQTTIEASQVLREVFLNSFEPDIIFSTNLQEGYIETAPTSVHKVDFPVVYITTLHDLIPLYFADRYLSEPRINKWYFEKIEFVKKSDYVLTVSNSSKNDIVNKLGIESDRVFVVENGYDSEKFNNRPVHKSAYANLKLRYGLSKPYFLYVGGADEHKNIPNLIRAYSNLESSEIDLVLVGKEAFNSNSIRDLIRLCRVGKSVKLLGYVDECDLEILYKGCFCFVFPSLMEGFGLPVLEALACGIPVISSNTGSIDEIVDYKDALFDPLDIDSISTIMGKVSKDSVFRSNLIKHGLSSAKKFSWKNSAEKFLNILDSIDINIKRKGYKFIDPLHFFESFFGSKIKLMGKDGVRLLAESVNESFSITRIPKIFLDISAVVEYDHKTGIQRVVRAICAELLSSKPTGFDVELVYTGTVDCKFYSANQYSRAIFKQAVTPHDSPVEFISGDILIYLDLHPAVAIAHKNYNLYLKSKGVSVYHVVYDILPILKPHTFWPQLCSEFRLWADVVSVSSGALCISRSVSNELMEYFSKFGDIKNPINIGFFRLGSDISKSAPTKGFPSNYNQLIEKFQSRTTFLMVGTIEPRKAHKLVIDCFERLWKKGINFNLVIVGKEGWGTHSLTQRIINHPNLNKSLFWLNGISDEFLDLVYKNSDCLIAASEGEGYGLPIIEASQYGIPLICRDIPVFREVAGSFANYFANTNKTEVLEKAILEWHKLFKNKKHNNSRGIKAIGWSESAIDLVDLIINQRWNHTINSRGFLYLNFIEDFQSSRLQFNGFAEPEKEFRWTNAKDPALIFFWDGQNTVLMRLIVGTHFQQRVKILVNGNSVYEEILNSEKCEIDFVCNLANGLNEVKFILPDAGSYSSDDPRMLALSFRSLECVTEIGYVTPNHPINHDSEIVLWESFSGAELDFRWTNNASSKIIFCVDKIKEINSCLFIFNTFGDQSLNIEFNGRLVHSGVYNGSDIRISFATEIVNDGINEIKLNHPNAQIPNIDDNRHLAIAVKEFSLQ